MISKSNILYKKNDDFNDISIDAYIGTEYSQILFRSKNHNNHSSDIKYNGYVKVYF